MENVILIKEGKTLVKRRIPKGYSIVKLFGKKRLLKTNYLNFYKASWEGICLGLSIIGILWFFIIIGSIIK